MISKKKALVKSGRLAELNIPANFRMRAEAISDTPEIVKKPMVVNLLPILNNKTYSLYS